MLLVGDMKQIVYGIEIQIAGGFFLETLAKYICDEPRLQRRTDIFKSRKWLLGRRENFYKSFELQTSLIFF